MGVSTIGVIKTEQRDAFVAYEKIRSVLNKNFVCSGNGIFKGKDIPSDRDANFRIWDGCLIIDFKDGKESRTLWVHFDCHNDYQDGTNVPKGKQVVFTIGCWDNSEKIIKLMLEQFADWGDCYFCANDSKREFIKL
jgi:hypothetical protein